MDENFATGWLLGPDGPVAGGMDGYERRDQQIEMGEAIADAFERGIHLVAEAGTGVGKSFAYLAAILQKVQEKRLKVIVSTYTISLQEQLIEKDIPFIVEASGVKLKVVLAKGRGNYLCWRRLEMAQTRQLTLFENQRELEALEGIYLWALETKDGSLSDLPLRPPWSVWEMVCSEQGTCRGKHCHHHGDCFYQRARRRLWSGDLVVTNHALLFCDLALRLSGGSLLPAAKHIIVDEAHNVENVASKHFGMRLSNLQVSFMLNRIFNRRTQKGILAPYATGEVVKLIGDAYDRNEIFFNEVLHFSEDQEAGGGNGRVKSTGTFANMLSEPLKKLGDMLRQIGRSIEDEQEHAEIDSYMQRCREFAYGVEQFINQQLVDHVYWVETRRRRSGPFAALCASPLDIGPTMKKVMFDPSESVILTSATLSTSGRRGENDKEDLSGFGFFATRLGLETFKTIQLGSPFDFENQVQVYVESGMPDPNDRERFMPAAAATIKKYLQQSRGRAFVLCTSFKQLNQLEADLQEFCVENDFMLLSQGAGKNRSGLLEEFRNDTHSVLLGTDSFWQGVDVRGESLSNVIILKLPFSVPDHPLLQAQLEEIKKAGGSPFFEYQLPEAILKFKQGFGRLIRCQSDQGIVVILDSRVVRKNYGGKFLRALPDCPVEKVGDSRVLG
ncbi:MAG: helicase [Planctomycetes bacterium]|nr:helicase [Planctomycetota bacterium]